MPNKAQAYAQLAEDTAKRLTSSLANWTGFLTTVGRLYKYPYHEQLMIYAQRPDATACAEYDLWNNTMNRYVRRGSKGIALLDPTGDTMRLKYVFDVSETGGRENSRRPFLWEMQEHHKEPILEMLKDRYDTEDNTLSDTFYNIARNLSREYYDNHKADISYLIENSFLEEYDEDNIRMAFEDATTVSTAYTLMKRCGLDTEGYFEHEDFLSIFDFNTADAVALLGTAVSEQSEQVFRQISLTITKTERERSKRHERNHLQQERGLSNTRPRIDTDSRQQGTDLGQIRENEETISSGTQDTAIPLHAPVGETVSPPIGNRPDSQQEAHADNDGFTEGTDPTRQDDTADGMGRLHEQSQSTGGGNDTDGTYIQLTLFPSEQEQIQQIADRQERVKTQSQSAFSISHSEIEYELKHGTGTQDGKLRVHDFYRKHPTEKAAIDFIKNEFGWYGHSHTFLDDTSGYIDYQPSKGMMVSHYDTDSKITLKWTEVEKYLRALVAADRYLNAEEKAQYEEQQLSTVEFGNFAPSPIIEPKPQPTLTNTVQAAPPITSTEITKADIETTLLHWNGNEDSKARMLAYMQDHSRERGTAEWLKNEYGGNTPTFTVTKGDLSLELPWAKVQRHIGQLVAEGDFYAQGEVSIPTVETVPQGIAELTLMMYDTKNPDIFKVKDNSYIVGVDVNATEEIWERFASKGLIPNEDSEQRLVFETDGKDWNRFFIPHTFGNKSNNIKALDVLTPDEYKTMWEVVKRVIPTEEKQTEITPIPYNKGDTVYLENGTPFLIEEISDHQVTLRDPTLFYPVLRAESRENFLRLLERYPQTKAVQEKAEDFRITDTHLGEGNKREKYQRNIAAITTLQTLEHENRPATKAEQETLSQYVGWGGLPEAFDDAKDNWHNEYLQLKDLLTEDEYEMARASTLNAHYTSPTVIKAIYDTVEQMGFQGGNILEPACGTGNFFGMLPDSIQGSKMFGVELDSITGRIAKQLYPSVNIAVTGFEKTDLPDSFFDLAIGNVPFGNYRLSEKRYDNQNFLIHDHFFAKALDKVRPGGIVAFVTSKGTMDKKNPEVRRYLAQRAELLGAIRLPNNAFSKNAGTEVTSDIIFLQKRDRPIDVERDWIHLGYNENDITLNSYFADHPEMILGNMEMVSGQFGEESACVPIEGADLSEQLKSAIRNIEGEISEADLPDMEISEQVSIPADPNVKNHTYALVDGEVYFRENSRMVKPALNQTAKERITGLVELRECVNDLIYYQLEDFSDEMIKAEQAKLNQLYDKFTAKYGLINSRGNAIAFSEDNSYYLLCSLEDVDEDGNLKAKADMFTKRTIKKSVKITSVDTPSEALAVSISEKAKVDMSFMAELTGLSEEEITTQLKGVIFRVPELYHTNAPPHYTTADEYLSGNVREKLRTAELAARTSEEYKVNVEALEMAQPKDLDASEIEVRIGSTWIDKEYMQEFMYELFDTPYRNQGSINVNYSNFTAEWSVTNKNSVSYDDVAAYATYGTDRANAYKIFEDTLNLRDVRIYDTKTEPDGKEIRVLNVDSTQLAQQKQQLIKDAFKDWIFRDADRRQTLVKLYNERFNSVRPRE